MSKMSESVLMKTNLDRMIRMAMPAVEIFEPTETVRNIRGVPCDGPGLLIMVLVPRDCLLLK